MNTISQPINIATARAMQWTATRLNPFGLLIKPVNVAATIDSIPHAELRALARNHSLLILRGFASYGEADFAHYCWQWGPLMQWNFGLVLNLLEQQQPRNYLFTSGKVPFHWDGAFREQIPEFQVFQCVSAPGDNCGGETLFTNTTAILEHASAKKIDVWHRTTVTYETEKIEHYGGTFTSPLLAAHERNGKPVLRYGEPADSNTSTLNPFQLTMNGITADEQHQLMLDMQHRLYSPHYCYRHSWQSGDFVIADNMALLHGRNPFASKCGRHIQRVHVL